jgi:hypothetical protein
LKILILDIENSFIVNGTFGLFNQNISLDSIFDGGKMLCYSYKWLGEDVLYYSRWDDDGHLELLWDALNEADAVVTYNGRRHDLPMINREFLKAGLPPPSPYKHIDLYETIKRVFKFPSNKMQWVLKELGMEEKGSHNGIKMWVDCLLGDETAWANMEEYNIGDTMRTEELYNRVLPWIPTHPNHSIYSNTGAICPKCGGTHLQRRGYYHTNAGRWPKFRCMDCGAWGRGRLMELDEVQRKSMLVEAP